jgi:hypothetical protein
VGLINAQYTFNDCKIWYFISRTVSEEDPHLIIAGHGVSQMTLAERADDERLSLENVNRVHLRAVPDRHRMRDGVEGTEPLEFGRFETHALRLQPLGEWDRVREQDLGAVLRSRTVEMVARDDTAGTRHVLHDDGRVAGNVAGEMLADDAAAGPPDSAAAACRPWSGGSAA